MRLSLVLALTLAAAHADAHVAPSVDDNNRYLKLTPLGDRVRLAYTVFYGEIPGAGLRRTIDRNHDGTIDEAESQAFGSGLADEVAAALDVTIDGARQPIAWSQVVVGMGTPDTAAGTFSIDLVSWLCLPSVRGKHALRLRDRFRLANPGETEVQVEDSPGITVDRARLGAADDPGFDFKLVGGGGALAEDGLDLQFTASPAAVVAADGVCQAGGAHRAIPAAALIGAAVVSAFVLAGLVTLVMRRRRRSAR